MKAKRVLTNNYRYWSCRKLEREWYKIIRWMRRKDCDIPVLEDRK